MSSFESTLARMKDLYTYGKELNENSKAPVYTLEYSAKAADGNTYGIIRECNKYYIKSATKGQERIAESYNYIGGFCNKKNYEYTSYNNALKNFELKMASINEACDANVNISTLDPFKKGDFLVEGTEKMRNEIARQRQIMYNASMIMNESTEIGADRKNDVVMFDGKNPEANTGKKGTEGMKNTSAKPDFAGSKTKGVNKKVAPFNNNTVKCADQLQEGCDCSDGTCSCEKDWASKGMGKGRDPKTIGWDIEGQTQVNEEEDWASAGLPSSAGVGEADTDKNNMPFNKSINEEDFDMEGDVEDVDVDTEVEDDDVDFDSEEDMDFDAEDDMDMDMDFDSEDDVDFDSEDDMDFDSEEDVDFDAEDDMDMDLDSEESEIDELRAEIERLKSELESLRGEEFDMEGELDADEDELDADEAELDAELDNEDDFETEDDMVFDDDDDVDMDFDGEDDVDVEDDMDMDSEDVVAESKRRTMNSIVESVVAEIINEDELHAWGKHPGYQKKPMELPSTGSDKNQWGEDWNDESVRSEQPFGTQKGDSTPFEKMVDAVTKTVMTKIAEEVNRGKKKVK